MKTTTIGLVLAVGALVFAAASCADSEQQSPGVTPPEDAATLPEPPPPDAGCEAGTDECSTGEIDCSQADFCPVTTGPDPRYALTSVWGSSKNDVWAVGSQGTILHYDGASWTKTPSGTKQTLFAVAGRGAGDVWAVSSREVLLHSTGFADGTARWIPAAPVAPQYILYEPANENLLLAVRLGAQDDVWLAGEPYPVLLDDAGTKPTNMNLWHRPSGAAVWDHGAVADTSVVRGLWAGGPDDVWAVGGVSGNGSRRPGRTFHSTTSTGEPVWTEFDSQSSTDLHAVWGSGTDDVWAVGNEGVVRHWTNATPKRWQIASVPTKHDLRAIWGTGPTDIWAVGDYGTILHFDGATWNQAVAAFPIGLKPHLRGVWGSGTGDVWAVGDSVVLHFTGKAGNP